MKLVGQGIVDRFNLRIGEQLFVRAIGFGDAECAGRFLGFVEVARGNRAQLDPFTLLQSRQYFLHADPRGAQYSPTNFVWHIGKSYPEIVSISATWVCGRARRGRAFPERR